ncbi:class I SAM-dependent methyltransferase [Mesorhizobium sp.]|uniref:class I SAM-dependent methyltransferase n=1 Tax=Mesorhizobium sp. TaxID=1871066 RepID=UPI000FE9F42F|nr:class I SAM-dependent methyltransferase [Mesorhizobium sp.]RWA58376.1 MAG: class I SAM-dependent methyltransferase [Mesorhizobium sp.]
MLDNYELDGFGVIHQIDFTPIEYDKQYISYYEDLSDRTIKLGYQRLGWVLGVTGEIPRSVLEIGYGTGTFIEAAKITGVADCAGCDIARFPLPQGVRFVDWDEALAGSWDLVAMFDVLEHIPDLSFLGRLQARHLAIAVPYCRWRELGVEGDAWFRSWRMRLPDEHLHHFDRDSLVALLAHHGFECVTLNSFEDGIRLRPGEAGPNILSGFFRKL